MRERKLYEKKRAAKGSGRAKTIPVQVSAELHGELSTIKGVYTKRLGRTVTFEQMLRRWIDRLSRIDSDVNDEYQVLRKTRLETEDAAVTTARDAVSRIFKRAQDNGTSAFAEALKEQEAAEAALAEDLRASGGDSPAPDGDKETHQPAAAATPDTPREGRKTEKRFVHPDGRQYPAIPGDKTPFYARIEGRGNVGQRTLFREGFELKDVEV